MRILDKLKTLYNDQFGGQIKKQAAKAAVLDSFNCLRERERARLPDDVALEGYKVYSQNDEDGIIDAIFSRIGSRNTYLEIGVESGIECNSHLLALKGWRGGWIDGNPQSCRQIARDLGKMEFPRRFRVLEKFVFSHNIWDIYRDHCAFLDVPDLDFFSLDIDGSDSFVVDQLMRDGARPNVICLEYNGKFPPDIDIGVTNSSKSGWERDDYFGASLLRLYHVMSSYDYRLVTCNLTGANVFFVHPQFADLFPARQPRDVWRPLRFDLSPLPAGHRPTLKFLRDVLNDDTNPD